MTIYNIYTIRELAPQQHECTPDMHFGYNAGRIKNRIYLPDTFVGATYYFDGEFSNRYGTSQLDDEGHPYIDINFNDGEIGNGTVFIIAGKRYCTFRYTLEYVNVFETEIDASEIDTSNLVTKQTFDNTVERIDNDITTGDTANRTAIDQLTAATNQRFADVNTKLSGYDEEIGAVDTEIKNLASEVDGYSTDIAKAVADAADAKSIAEGAADDAATASAEAGEAKDAVLNLETRVTQVETDVESAETVANQAKSAADAAAQTAGSAQSTASAAQSAAGAAQISANVAKTAADNAQSAADEAKQAAQANAGEITTIKGQVTAIQQKNTEQDGKIGTLESTTAGTTETVNTLQENFNNLNDSVGNLGTAVHSLQQSVSALDEIKTDIEDVKEQVESGLLSLSLDNDWTIESETLTPGEPILIPKNAICGAISITLTPTADTIILRTSYYNSRTKVDSESLIMSQNSLSRSGVLETGVPTTFILYLSAGWRMAKYYRESASPVRDASSALGNIDAFAARDVIKAVSVSATSATIDSVVAYWTIDSTIISNNYQGG